MGWSTTPDTFVRAMGRLLREGPKDARQQHPVQRFPPQTGAAVRRGPIRDRGACWRSSGYSRAPYLAMATERFSSVASCMAQPLSLMLLGGASPSHLGRAMLDLAGFLLLEELVNPAATQAGGSGDLAD